jgi:hypothetical protein
MFEEIKDPHEDEDRCHCGECRLCLARSVSEDDEGGPCSRCGGAGCSRCEE